MKCKKCNANIYGKADFCPICKSPITEDAKEYNNEYVYPIKKKRSKKYKIFTFTPLYIIISSIVFVALMLVNFFVTPEILWYGIVGIVLIYCYILVQNTILSRSSIAHKIIWQALLVFSFLWVLEFMLYQIGVIEEIWVYVFDYSLPVVVGVSNLIMCILTACFVKKDRGLIVDAMWFSCTGFIPLILYGAGFGLISYPSVAVAIMSVVQIIILLSTSWKWLKDESKLKYRA